MLRLVSNVETVQHFEKNFNECTIRYGDMKKQLAEDIIQYLKPIREKAAAIENDKTYLSKIISMGADKANASAAHTMKMVRKSFGLLLSIKNFLLKISASRNLSF